jgi:hypothetical protein
MPRSMVIRSLPAAFVVLGLAGCGAGSAPAREVRVLAPAGLVDDVGAFERRTGCRVDLRVYDAGEDVAAIAKRRNVDVVAEPVARGGVVHDSVELVRVEVAGGLSVTVPKELASAFRGPRRPAGRRDTRWAIRTEGQESACAKLWWDYATSQ